MDPVQVIEEFGVQGRLPVEAIRAAQADRETMVPVFLRTLDDFLSLQGPVNPDALFFIFHLLGEWREKSAYWPLAVLLRLPPDVLDSILGDAITETSHRVMAAVFDGDPEPLYEIIRDPEADEYVRANMLPDDRHADAAWRAAARSDGGLPARLLFATRAAARIATSGAGWIDAVAWLGLTELKPLVQQAFQRKSIDPEWLTFKDFEEELQYSGRSSRSRTAQCLTAISLCSAIRLRNCRGGTPSNRRRRATTSPNRGTEISRDARTAIPCAKSGATIPVPAAAAKNSRNAA